MEMELAASNSGPGRLKKVTLVASSVLAITLATLATWTSIGFANDYTCNSECIPADEAIQIMWVGFAVAAVLFAAAGLAISACIRPVRFKSQVAVSVALGIAGGAGWMVWLLMLFTAGIRATT